MNYYIFLAFSLSIYIAVVLAIIRFKKIDKIFYPVIFCFWLGALNDSLSIYLTLSGQTTTMNNNIYVLVESLLLIYFFDKAGLFKNQKTYLIFLALFLFAWLAENFVFGSVRVNSTYFRIVVSFTIVLLSIGLINRLIFATSRNLWKNASFLICIAFIFYFTYKVLVQSFVLYGIDRRSSFLLNIYLIMIYINLGTNLLYAYSVLWMHKRTRFLTG